MLKTNFDKLKQTFINLKKQLEQNEFWKLFILYYKKIDNSPMGNAIMDLIEKPLKQRFRSFYVLQTEEEIKALYRDMRFMFGFGWLIWLNLTMWSILLPALFDQIISLKGFVPFDQIKFPLDHIYPAYDILIKKPFVIQPEMYIYDTHLSFKLDASYIKKIKNFFKLMRFFD